MNITIPIYIEQLPQPDTSALYAVRPLFFQQPVARAEELQRAIARFVKAMRRTLNDEGKLMRHDALAAYSFAPEVEDHLLKLTLDLKTRTVHVNFLFVTFEKFERRVAFTPSLPQLWLEVARGEDLQARATEVLTRYFRGKEKLPNDNIPTPEEVAAQGKAWASTVEIEINPPLVGKTPKEEFRALLGGGETLDGEAELHQTGRCLDWLYPDELGRVIAREREVAELTRLLRADDRRPVLLAGPRLVGKTALVEEYVYRRIAAGKPQYDNKNEVWLLAPQRLISGMSYVGQWENRLLAIIKEARERDHILYFDDLLGLFKAGLSRDANLNVAQVLKPYLERREVRVLGETTPEAWRVLREQDRGLADLFQLLPINEPNEDETFEMLLGLQRQLEQQHHCQFEPEALPVVIDLQRRYVRDAAFPGKAAQFLRQLAVKNRHSVVARHTVFWEFQNKSGLAAWFLNDWELARADVISTLGRRVKGQEAAVAALADAVAVAKACLNDPDRPFAAFLFLGPTGVGKTQCAKSLAAYLFSNDERLLRFDMNEFVAADAVARLVGTFDQPEGLLTSAVRRQPFSVVLFDEIEKAHPDVFNLLLQVLGDGRLTDALGRTADFTNTILILTSNLGVKEASSELGFATERANEASIYTQAAERFFSPEFFNRLDRVVPFARLDRATVKEIANVLLWEVFSREGLQRRRASLLVYNDALERLVDAGYHPQLGARALKRAIEKQVTHSLAARLAAQPRTQPTLIEVLPARQHLHLNLQELQEAPPHESSIEPLLATPAETLARIEAFLLRLDDEITALQPAGAISLDALQPEHYRYFALREQIGRLRRMVERLSNQLAAASRASTRLTGNYARLPRRPPQPHADPFRRTTRQLWKQVFAAEDIHAFLRELTAAPVSEELAAQERVADAVREAAWLALLARSQETDTQTGALVLFHSLHSAGYDACRRDLLEAYRNLFITEFDWEAAPLHEDDRADDGQFYRDWLTVRGTLAASLLAREEGTHLNFADNGLLPIQIKVFALAPGQDAHTAQREKLQQYAAWLKGLAAHATLDAALLQANPFRLSPVTRIYNYAQGQFNSLVDVRSGFVMQGAPASRTLRALLLAGLPLPPELL